MNKKAAIKQALRDVLQRRPNKSVLLERSLTNVASLNYGNWTMDFTFSEYDDEGDPSTEAEYSDIYASLQTIVNDHNNQV